MGTDIKAIDGRIYVPIKYIAEALGGWVSYSDLFSTIIIYDDVLYPDEIEYLTDYGNIYPEVSFNFPELAKEENEKIIKEWYDSYPELEFFDLEKNEYGYENAHEWILRNPNKGSYEGRYSKLKFSYGESPNEDFAKQILAEAKMVSDLLTKSNISKASFYSDLSGVYRGMSTNRHCETVEVRGILEIEILSEANLIDVKKEFPEIVDPQLGMIYGFDIEVKVAVYESGYTECLGYDYLGHEYVVTNE